MVPAGHPRSTRTQNAFLDSLVGVLVILLLVALSAVFSGMETALVSLNEMKLRQRLESGRAPMMLRRWHDGPNDVLATLLIGNNVVNILASALATDLTHTLLAGTSVAGFGIPIAVGVMTLLVLVCGEVVPKTYAKHNPEKYLVLLPVVTATYWISYPLMKVLVGTSHRAVALLGGEIDGRETVTEEDIENLVRIGRSDGSMSPEATRLLTGIFELDDKVAREIMIPRTDLKALAVDATMEEVLEMVGVSGYSRYPIYRDSIDDIVGILYVKDILAFALNPDATSWPKLEDIMRKPMVRPWNINVRTLMAEMQRERVHLAVIASEYGGVAGVLTMEDIVEEVFGPIYDEHDRGTESFRLQADGSWIVEGVLAMRELEASLDVEFPDDDEDFETVAGLVMHRAGKVPVKGFETDFEGFRFRVLSADSTRVNEVAVCLIDTSAELAAAGAG
ncbi:MAG: putative hemolysin [Myxococcota bacterium]